MKRQLGLFGLSLAVVALPLLAGAQTWQANRLYVKLDLGGNYTADTDLKTFFGEDTYGAKIEFDPGYRFGFAGGYNVTTWFSPEIEIGVVENWIDSISGPGSADASYSRVPLMVNAKFQLPNRSLLTPYVGAGVGMVVAILDADYFAYGNTVMEGTDSDVVFAWQAYAGLKLDINERMAINLEYHYLWADSPDWHAHSYYSMGTDRMAFGRTDTHSLSLAFELTF
jgi:opacity protein-like surface antigen